MPLNTYVAEKRMEIFQDLQAGRAPREGSFSEEALREGKVKGQPQVGTTRFEPTAIVLEFIYPDPKSTATVLPVRIEAPERIIFMPVPGWVVESIWQGEIDGSYRFESEAAELLAEYAKLLAAEANQQWFGKQSPKRRE